MVVAGKGDEGFQWRGEHDKSRGTTWAPHEHTRETVSGEGYPQFGRIPFEHAFFLRGSSLSRQ